MHRETSGTLEDKTASLAQNEKRGNRASQKKKISCATSAIIQVYLLQDSLHRSTAASKTDPMQNAKEDTPVEHMVGKKVPDQ
ncbi:hypothetical protein HYALB_00000151 [Hymenoscyphus albidus]|uniref:Uncharacterized protein n=1 Tax=Hymenoscyphus albidus TaxID=595503 RepID=A0A9N9LG28_9HELO|nr:hypothetical protein HYALB_00000151 [Hymenoscyphus albidus]